MNKKEIKILDDAIQNLCTKQDRIWDIRQAVKVNTSFDFLKEVETIERLYESVLELRKKTKGELHYISSSGWTIMLMRKNIKYKKDEKFNIHIIFSFVEYDSFL